MSRLGATVVVQGGTFLNPAVQRAFEQLSGTRVVCPDISGLMGAYGAALVARDRRRLEPTPLELEIDLHSLMDVETHVEPALTCSGCGNRCHVTRLSSPQGAFVSGNRCERIFSSGKAAARRGVNLVQVKHDLLFDRRFSPEAPERGSIRIGLPPPSTCTRISRSGRHFSSSPACRSSCRTVDAIAVRARTLEHHIGHICMPAKLANGHILDAGSGRRPHPLPPRRLRAESQDRSQQLQLPHRDRVSRCGSQRDRSAEGPRHPV